MNAGSIAVGSEILPLTSLDRPLAISGRTNLYAIIGDPIAQAGSPTLFNRLFAARGLDAVLVPMEVAEAGLASVVAGFRSLRNLRGFIVTKPHKSKMLDYVDRAEPAAVFAKALNVVRCGENGIWTAGHFDGFGCVEAMRAHGHTTAGRSVFLAGLGGAGRAAAYALADAGSSSIVLHDVDSNVTARTVAEMRESFPTLRIEARNSDVASADILVNCTPLGMRDGDALPFSLEGVRRGAVVVDFVIGGEQTPLLRRALDLGCQAVPGQHVLEGQAKSVLEFFGLSDAAANAQPDSTHPPP